MDVYQIYSNARLLCYYFAGLFLLFIIFRYIIKRMIFVQGLSPIPGPFGIPLLGNSLSLTGGQDDFFRLLLNYRKIYGSIFKLWIGMRPFVFISDAQYVSPILNSSLHIDKSYEYTFLHPWLGTGLLTATGSKWHSRRKLLTPTFHHSLLEGFIQPIIEKSKILISLLENEVGQPPFDVLKYTKLCALDIICVTAMGKDVNAQLCHGTEYVQAVEGLNKILQRRFITPWLKPDFIFKRCQLGRQQENYINTINNFVSQVIEDKKNELKKTETESEQKSTSKHPAFLDLILKTRKDGQALSDNDIREEVNTFMFAGHDTTSVAISWCLFALGKHQSIQKNILEEYETVVKNKIPTFDEIQKLEYLENCIKETLRLYPVVPLIARDIKHKIDIDGKTRLLPGVTALIFTPSLHRDCKVFQEPNEFMPDRFKENKTRNPFSYIPFSAGPRNCIGAKFAMIEVKIVLYNILKNYEIISVDSEKDLNLMSEIVLSNKEGIRIILEKRKRKICLE
ncbi:cytochrome P-450, putative [Pediculus humanus corporis]|uniref:Cytochrome P-450, putative n=1 Tax=Pediculus humanus subsp. corporis TaxID=121224 RepID=E0VV39_PEDHC|nr:cytochrome P-450, putative [Pediculus humanus corporis]EEB17245.1 cytochrome P-450, putative [Pediculus humanus corporis]